MFIFRSVLQRLRDFGPRRSIDIHSVDSLRFLVQRERFRADRSGREFAMIAIRFQPSPLAATGAEEEVIQWLLRELRITDDVGHLDDGRVGVILPDTGAAGAEVVADRIRLECATHDVKNDLQILTYPDSDDQQSSQIGGFEQQPATDTEPAGQTLASVRPLTSLQSMIVQPMPRWKRAIDIAVSGSLIAITAPLQVIIALAIKATSSGPVIFAQHRSGLGGQPYQILKFRTMVDGAETRQEALLNRNEQDGPAFKMKDDPRVTPLGRFLRKTSLDELPQLVNVFRGEMSLVGPRPLPCYETDACDHWQKSRLDVTPGITCVWQVYGRGRVNFDNWVRMDVEYIRTRSVLTDVKLLLMTVPAVLSGRGAA